MDALRSHYGDTLVSVDGIAQIPLDGNGRVAGLRVSITIRLQDPDGQWTNVPKIVDVW